MEACLEAEFAQNTERGKRAGRREHPLGLHKCETIRKAMAVSESQDIRVLGGGSRRLETSDAMRIRRDCDRLIHCESHEQKKTRV